jgi:hypothetical protein
MAGWPPKAATVDPAFQRLAAAGSGGTALGGGCDDWPRIEPVVTEELEDGPAPQRVLCPFDLQVWAVDRMLNLEITDDPYYEGLELQASMTLSTAGG